MANKNNIRSIRFSDELANIINQQQGDTFTAKLENLVTRAYMELPTREAELEHINAEIKKKRKELQELSAKAFNFKRQMDSMTYTMENIAKAITVLSKSTEA